jgi:hypothetical protein
MFKKSTIESRGASKGLEKLPDNVTKFVGKDFKKTYRKVASG